MKPVALYTSASVSLPTRDSFSLWTGRSAFFQAFFSAADSAITSVLPDAFTPASASSFSFFAMSFANLVASYIAPSSAVRMSAGSPSQNFLLTMTAYSMTP